MQDGSSLVEVSLGLVLPARLHFLHCWARCCPDPQQAHLRHLLPNHLRFLCPQLHLLPAGRLGLAHAPP